jgi:hypothetical protein
MESDQRINIISKKRLNSREKSKVKILIFKLFFYFIILIFLLLNQKINNNKKTKEIINFESKLTL